MTARSIGLFIAAALIGASLAARATEPCTPTTSYSLVASAMTIDGAAATPPPGTARLIISDYGGDTIVRSARVADPEGGSRTLSLGARE